MKTAINISIVILQLYYKIKYFKHSICNFTDNYFNSNVSFVLIFVFSNKNNNYYYYLYITIKSLLLLLLSN